MKLVIDVHSESVEFIRNKLVNRCGIKEDEQ